MPSEDFDLGGGQRLRYSMDSQNTTNGLFTISQHGQIYVNRGPASGNVNPFLSSAPGVNTYIFANMYGVGKRTAATSLLAATALSILTIWIWLMILP